MGIKVEEKTRQAMEVKMAKMGDYVKMDYLQRALTSGIDLDTRKFVLSSLSKLYEVRGMYLEAGKMMKNAAEINVTFNAKIADYMKSVDLYIKGGNYAEADMVFALAIALAAEKEKPALKTQMKNYYLTCARTYVKADKRSLAKKSYEKLLTMDIDMMEKKQIQQELLVLYEKLGNLRDYYKLKETL